MFKITVNNPNGQSETFDMSGMQFHEIYDKFEKNGIKASPYGYTMGDARKENAPITLSSDSDMGNAVLKLFIDKETIYDVYAVEHGLSRVPEEFRDEIEQNILNEQYRYPEYIFEDVNRMIRETSAAHETFYCPLVGNVHYAEDGDYGEVMNDTLLENVDAIEERLAREQMPEMNMAEYVGDHSGLGSKLRLAEWQVEEIGGTLYGKIDCYFTEPITPEETERLRDAIRGQNSDGFGESFEQREISIDEGNLYVSFWNSEKDYFLHTQDEMDDYLSQLRGMRFGGV